MTAVIRKFSSPFLSLSNISNRRNTIFSPRTSSQNEKQNSNQEGSSEINEIFNKILAESSKEDSAPPYQSIAILSIYLRRNRQITDDIIKKLSFYFNSHANELSDKIIVYTINTLLSLLTENSHIMNFINMNLPILVNLLYFNNKSLSSIENINNTIARLIKIGGIYTRQIIEKQLESLLLKFNKENESINFKFENTKFALIQFLCKVIESSSLFIFNKIKEKNSFELFLNVISYFEDPKKEIRFMVGETVKVFIHLLNGRDSKTKNDYLKSVYNFVFSHFLIHAKENNDIPMNNDFISGFLIILQKIYLSEPSFFKETELYKKLVENLMKCKNSIKNPPVLIEFIKFIPQLYQMNKDIFSDCYVKDFLTYANTLLNIKTSNEIRNAILLTMGTLSLVIDPAIFFEISLPNLLDLMKTLMNDKKIFDEEIFKCLSDLLNNKDNLYLESVMKQFDLFFVLSKLFKTRISTNKIEFLISVMSAFNKITMVNINTTITSLNVISIIFSDDDFKLNYFYKSLDDEKKQLISPQLENILSETRKNIRRDTTQNTNDTILNTIININNTINEIEEDDDKNKPIPFYCKCKCADDQKLILLALSLFSQIKNTLFYKDMFIFYNDNILPFLLFSSNKITKKILDLILCGFIDVYPEDENLSNYIINNILDSIKNIIVSNKDISIKAYTINILNKKSLLFNYILLKKEVYISRFIGILTSNEDDYIKEKIVKSLGLIASSKLETNDKKYFMTLVRKNINSILFVISNTEDIIQKENMIILLLYYNIYLKDMIDTTLIEQTMEVFLKLLFNYENQGNMIINILKIVSEILNNNNFINNYNNVGNDKFNEYCQLFLLICVLNIKESGINTKKSEICLKTLYSLIKLQKIDIYKDYTPKKFLHKSNIINNISNSAINNNYNNNIEENNNNKDRKSDIFLKYNGKNVKINIIKILLLKVIKGASDESLKYILDIFGLCGAMEPKKMELFLSLQGLSSERETYEDNGFIIRRFVPKTKTYKEIDLSSIDQSTTKSVFSLLRIIKDNTQQELSTQIISHLNLLIKSLSNEESNLIDIILPDIIEVIPLFELNYQTKLFEDILIITFNFKEKIITYLDDIVHLIKNYILNDSYLEIIIKILQRLFEEYVYEMEKYYPTFIPIFLSLIKNKKENNANYQNIVKLFSLLTKNNNISSYLGIMITELSMVYLEVSDDQVTTYLLDFAFQITHLENTCLFYPIIITTLLEKFKLLTNPKYYQNSAIDLSKLSKEKQLEYLFKTGPKRTVNLLIISKSINVFIDMNNSHRDHFIEFLPLIVNTCIETGIINYGETKNKLIELIIDYSDYTFMKPEDYTKKISLQVCKINCIFGFNPLSSHQNYYINSPRKRSIIDAYLTNNNSSNENRVPRPSIRIKMNQKDNMLIIRTFDSSNCIVEEDWNEWFKSIRKVLFEQSPSYSIKLCNVIADYYLPLVIELFNYGFFSVYINFNVENKLKLVSDFSKALQNPKTPNDILLNILNLAEFIERKNIKNFLTDYSQFGDIAYKCHAFAKSLYYKENNFLLSNDYEHFEDLLELYYELQLPESAIGLLKLAEKNRNEEIKKKKEENDNNGKFKGKNNDDVELEKEKEKKDNEYKYYIKLHEYQKALKMIESQLLVEQDKNSVDTLKKNRGICLNGLCDWEELFNEDNKIDYNYDSSNDEEEDDDEKNNNNNNINNNKKNNNPSTKNINSKDIQKIINNEIVLSKACMNLSKWSQFKFHFTKIQKLFRGDNDTYENFIINNEKIILNDFNINDEEVDENDQNNFYKSHGIIRIKLYDILTNEVDNYNKYLILNSKKSRKKVGTVNNNSSAKVDHRFSDRGSAFGLSQFFKENDFIAYNEIINKNPNFIFLENQSETLFELNLYSIILNINEEKYDIAYKFINSGKQIVLSGIKSLLNESYTRGYELLIKNQLLFQLEQIIDYRQSHSKDKKYLTHMVQAWDKSMNIIGKDPAIYEKFLAIRSLVLPIEEEYTKYMDLSKIYRKLNLYDQSEKILKRIKDKMKLDCFNIANNEIIDEKKEDNLDDDFSLPEKFTLIKNDLLLTKEIKIQIELQFNECLFEKGLIDEAISKSKYLVDLLDESDNNNKIENNINQNNLNLNLSKINNLIKSKIYGSYAIYIQSKLEKSHNILSVRNLKPAEDTKSQKMKKISLGKKQKTTPLFGGKNILKKNSFGVDEIENESVDLINKYLLLATKYNKNSYKLWHAYAMFNYKCHSILSKFKIGEIDGIPFAINSINGFKNSLIIGGKNKNKTFQDLLRVIDVFFNSGGKSDELLSLISNTFNLIDIDAYLNVLPQLTCRFDIKESNILGILINILIKIGKAHPQAVIYSFVVMKLSTSRKRKSAASQILFNICKNEPQIKELVDECEMFIDEINKCAMLLHEEWHETLENASKMYYDKDYQGMVINLRKLHEKSKKKPENMYEINFYQKYGSQIRESEYFLNEYIESNNRDSLNAAWDLYFSIYTHISDDYQKFQTISLEYVSSKLYKFENSKISLPGSYDIANNYSKHRKIYKNDQMQYLQDDNINQVIRIQKMGNILKLFNTKQHPRKISMIGTDDKEYLFLLKGHEDLRQDERAMQLFNLVNTILANDKQTYNKNLYIVTYSVFPLSHNTGIIGWVPNCDTLHQLIKEQRAMSKIVQSIEHRKMYKLYPKFESSVLMGKIEMFQEAIKETHGLEINNILWYKSQNCEKWLNRRTNYSRSLAVMSIVGYILGLGDRHPSNLMMDRKSGKIIHIDFGDCFEVAMKREKFPERVPFRLTRMLVKALEVCGIEGTFRIISEKVMRLLRDNKDSLLAILGSFLYDPLISFRLMIPMIMKLKNKKTKNFKEEEEEEKEKEKKVKEEKEKMEKEEKEKKEENDEKLKCNIETDKNVSKNKLTPTKTFMKSNSKTNVVWKNMSNKKDNYNNNNSNDKFDIKGYSQKRKSTFTKDDETIVDANEEQEKKEKIKIENDERQIFNLYEENEEFDTEELNNIAQIVLDRILDKLSGTDFDPNVIYDVRTQVDELIKQATSYENLAQSYLGWCPFW